MGLSCSTYSKNEMNYQSRAWTYSQLKAASILIAGKDIFKNRGSVIYVDMPIEDFLIFKNLSNNSLQRKVERGTWEGNNGSIRNAFSIKSQKEKGRMIKVSVMIVSELGAFSYKTISIKRDWTGRDWQYVKSTPQEYGVMQKPRA